MSARQEYLKSLLCDLETHSIMAGLSLRYAKEAQLLLAAENVKTFGVEAQLEDALDCISDALLDHERINEALEGVS